MSAQPAVVTVDSERASHLDVGPCCDYTCDRRATRILTLHVNGLQVTAWTCDEHRKRLP